MKSALLVLAALALSPVAYSATIAISIDTQSPPEGSSALMRGWAFTTSTSLTITGLGWYDSNQDGLSASHQVGIWNITGGSPLITGTVSAGTVDPLVNLFRFTSTLTGDATLDPGSYVIGGLSVISDLNARLLAPGEVAFAPGITYIEDRVGGSTVFESPSDHGGFDIGYFGPNFLAEVSEVPEPTTIALVGGALGFLWLVRRSGRRVARLRN